jgi:hypothetical protein
MQSLTAAKPAQQGDASHRSCVLNHRLNVSNLGSVSETNISKENSGDG